MPASHTPTASIVIPSFNQGAFIEQTIVSLLDQDIPNLEIIVMDGGSTDQTVEILNKYDKQLTYWDSKPDKGQSDAINKGFRISKGKYVNWLCSDDYLLPGALQSLISYLDNHDHIDVVFGNAIIVNSKGDFITHRNEIPFHYKTTLYAFNHSLQPSALFRKSCLEKAGYVREDLHFSMDHELWLRFYKKGLQFGYINKDLSAYRYHPASKGTAETGTLYRGIRNDFRRQYGFKSGFVFLDMAAYKALEAIYRTRRKLLKFIKHGDFSFIPLSAKIETLNRQGKL